jgi:hypothetical protein
MRLEHGQAARLDRRATFRYCNAHLSPPPLLVLNSASTSAFFSSTGLLSLWLLRQHGRFSLCVLSSVIRSLGCTAQLVGSLDVDGDFHYA